MSKERRPVVVYVEEDIELCEIFSCLISPTHKVVTFPKWHHAQIFLHKLNRLGKSVDHFICGRNS